MPKKKSAKKKKSSKSVLEEKHATGDPSDPGTLIAADATDAGIGGLLSESPSKTGKGKKKKGKGKKVKMSKSEKDVARLEKACDAMRAEKGKFHDFINRMDNWLTRNHITLNRYFRRFDEHGDGILTYDEFKSGMMDFVCPCTDNELYMLCKLLDRENTGEIDFTLFGRGLKYIRELEDLEREEEEADKMLILTQRTFEKCKCCKMSVNGPYQVLYPKYILLELRLVTFNDIKDHPAHFEVLIHAHIPVSSLQQIIVDETGILSTKLSIFRDKSRSQKAMLPMALTLQELGYEGDTYDDPEELQLFYDYKVEFIDCPLLLCDHYFGQKVEVHLGRYHGNPTAAHSTAHAHVAHSTRAPSPSSHHTTDHYPSVAQSRMANPSMTPSRTAHSGNPTIAASRTAHSGNPTIVHPTAVHA